MEAFDELLDIMRRLREPVTGCPWDLEQTLDSIIPHTLDEVYEVIDAIERRDFDALPAELGDLMFQVVFYCRIAEEESRFDIGDVLQALTGKLRDRHPHVFGGERIDSAAAQTRAWEARKAAERAADGKHSLMDDVPTSLPALARALKLQRRAAQAGFDWTDRGGVLDKVTEELGELHEQLAAGDAMASQEEFGDLLFTMLNLARHLDIDAEAALRGANRKFEHRFRCVERLADDRQQDLGDRSIEELETLWQEAKRLAG
ncbi:MAG: nucleoside triphosphate pyrophosphohydrolase [Gammaproteobacteria bacterium]|nr:nucleoside triphosphate pyrophosphohydrolase [Gammaproteobacteria bacterium]